MMATNISQHQVKSVKVVQDGLFSESFALMAFTTKIHVEGADGELATLTLFSKKPLSFEVETTTDHKRAVAQSGRDNEEEVE